VLAHRVQSCPSRATGSIQAGHRFIPALLDS
jgi:hypothetical protein